MLAWAVNCRSLAAVTCVRSLLMAEREGTESARDGVLLRGLIDWVALERAHRMVANAN